MNTIKRNAYTFFKEHAGYIVGESALCALRLAKAEYHAGLIGMSFKWEWDEYADYSWMTEKERHKEHEVYECVAYDRDGRVTASLCGIFDPSNQYKRVIEAELSLESLEG